MQEPISTYEVTNSPLNIVKADESAGFALQVVDQCTKGSEVFNTGAIRAMA